MSWPAQSPDINIIENIWLHIKRKLQGRISNSRVENKDDLWFYFPIDSFSSMDYTTFNGLPEFYNQNPNEVCFLGGFAIGRRLDFDAIAPWT